MFVYRGCIIYQGATQQQKDMMEHAAHVLAQDNVELACAFIQKTAVEKAIPEMDKRLATVSLHSAIYEITIKNITESSPENCQILCCSF